jgi:hypothetical protein
MDNYKLLTNLPHRESNDIDTTSQPKLLSLSLESTGAYAEVEIESTSLEDISPPSSLAISATQFSISSIANSLSLSDVVRNYSPQVVESGRIRLPQYLFGALRSGSKWTNAHLSWYDRLLAEKSPAKFIDLWTELSTLHNDFLQSAKVWVKTLISEQFLLSEESRRFKVDSSKGGVNAMTRRGSTFSFFVSPLCFFAIQCYSSF